MDEIERIELVMAKGEHTDGDLAFAVEQWKAALLKLPAWRIAASELPTRGESPKYSDLLLVADDGAVWLAAYCFMDQSWRDQDDRRVHATHWMPLPEPPK